MRKKVTWNRGGSRANHKLPEEVTNKFRKRGEFHIGENRGKQETIYHHNPRKQCYPSKQLPPLSVII